VTDGVRGTTLLAFFLIASLSCGVALTTGYAGGTKETAAATGTVALLLPDTVGVRYESADRPDFVSKLRMLAPAVQVIYANARSDSVLQRSQAEAALQSGAQVLVIGPVDPAAAGTIADEAREKNVAVIAYDRMIMGSAGVNYYVSFDEYQAGALQASSLVSQLDELNVSNPAILMINGSPNDDISRLVKQGAHGVLDPLVAAGKLTIRTEYDAPDDGPDQARNEVLEALKDLGGKVDGVYCADDGLAAGAVAALKTAGLSPLPPVTGRGAELAAVKSILTGDQFMTVYQPVQPEAEAAAALAFDLLTHTLVAPGVTNGETVTNGLIDVPSVLLAPVVVTRDTVKDTVVKDGFWTAAQVGLP